MQKLVLFFRLPIFLSLVSFSSLSTSVAAPPAAFGLNDVSILLPLPKSDEELEYLLSPHEGLNYQEILPQKYLSMLDPLILDDEESGDRWDQLRVVALRFDPCFFEGEGPVVCRRQIRLVFQAVSAYSWRPMAFDASVHAFYEFGEKEWQSVLAAWKQTLSDSPTNALQVHPRILAEGLSGRHWDKLKNIVQKFCRADTLVRVTESSVTRFGLQWHFMGFDIRPGGKAEAMIIPRIQKPKQQFSNGLGNLKEFDSELYPSPNEPGWAKFLNSSARSRTEMSEAELMGILKKSFEFENPTRFNTANLDCASCHIAQSVRIWGENNLKGWEQNAGIAQVRFTSKWNLEHKYKMPLFTNRVRAFGYFIDEVNISPRVINETAIAADLLSQSLNSSR